MSEKNTFFSITFRDFLDKDLKLLTIKAHEITDSNLGLGFICISKIIFEEDGLVVNPTLEKIKNRFGQTKNLHLSIHHIISIEEIGIENQGLNFKNKKDNLYLFPNNPETPN